MQQSKDSNCKVYFTWIVQSPKTAKQFAVDKDGNVFKPRVSRDYKGEMRNGHCERSKFKDFLKDQEPGSNFLTGTYKDRNLEQGSIGPVDDIRRKNDEFPHHKEPGLIVIDIDSIDQYDNLKNSTDIRNALVSIHSGFANAHLVFAPSASSYISVRSTKNNTKKDEWEEFSGLKGMHVYAFVEDATKIPEILDILHVRSVLAEFRIVKLNVAGRAYVTSLFDLAMKKPSQPNFCGGAYIADNYKDRIKQKRNENIEEFIGGYLGKIKPLTASDRKQYDEVVAKLRHDAENTNEAKVLRKQYKEEYAIKVRERNADLTDEQISKKLERALTHNTLDEFFIITLEDGSEVTVKDILDDPKKYHGKECCHPIEKDIIGKTKIYSDQDRPTIHSFAHGGETYQLVLNTWEDELEVAVEKLNESHIETFYGGKHFIMRLVNKVDDEGSDLGKVWEFLKPFDFVNFNTSNKIKVGEKFNRDVGFEDVLSPVNKAWKDHPKHRNYDQVVFSFKEINNPRVFNMWQGLPYQPVDRGYDLAPMLDHMKNIICRGHDDQYEYLMNWMAFTVQKPEEVPGVAIIMRGDEGTGKSVVAELWSSLFGDYSLKITNQTGLTGKFNGHLENKLGVFCDEAFFHGDKAASNILKNLITSDSLFIEHKGFKAVERKSYLKIMMSTNNEHVVDVGRDARRFCVFDVSGEKRGDHDYFARLHGCKKTVEARETFLYQLMNRDISNFNIRAFPETDGLKEQRLQTAEHGLVGFFIELMNNEIWLERRKSGGLYEKYCDWQEEGKYRTNMSMVSFGKLMKELFECKAINGCKYYLLGTKNELIKKLEKHYKINLSDLDINETSEEVYQRTRTDKDKLLKFDQNKRTVDFVDDEERANDNVVLLPPRRTDAGKYPKLKIDLPVVTGNVVVSANVLIEEEIDDLGNYYKDLK